MKISVINAYKVTLPFKFPLSHSQKNAKSVDNIVVEILTDEQELAGYGEGGPRPYVTAETQDTAIRDVKSLCLDKRFPWDLNNVKQIWNLVDSAFGERNHNSALCALETALLDVIARKENRSILYYLPKDYLTDKICYSATVPIGDPYIVARICAMLKEFDIKVIRLKMGKDFERNRQTIETVSQLMQAESGLRVDVNGAWNLELAKQHLPLLVSCKVTMVEQPLTPDDNDWGKLADILRTRDIKLMADESVCSVQDTEKAIEDGYFDAINVRLSKCGGFHSSLKIIEKIRDAGLHYQVGCQLGESGILSAAGRALCAVSSDALYFEGSYDAVVLEENITTEHVTFKQGGKADVLRGSGLGVLVDRRRLKQFSNSPVTIKRR